MPLPIIEAFSISHAAILDGTTGADAADIFRVLGGTVDIDTDSYSNTGDDFIQSIWNWFNNGNITISSGYMGFDMYSLITGATVTSSGSGQGLYVSAPLWNLSSLNQPARPVLLRCPAKLNDQTVRSLDIVLYKVQMGPVRFDGPSYKKGLTFSFTGQALMSSVDEKGVTLTDPSIGRFVSRPRI